MQHPAPSTTTGESGDPAMTTLPEKSEMSEEDIVRALYRIFLGRAPDRIGLRDWVQTLRDGRGIGHVATSILSSEEFGARHKTFVRDFIRPEFLDSADRESAPEELPSATKFGAAGHVPVSKAAPRIADFTPEQARWLRSLAPRPTEVLLAQFRLEPGSRPTIYLQDHSRLPHRSPQSIAYIDGLISNYLLHPDYFDLHVDGFPPDCELFCLVQIDDRPPDIAGSVAYCSQSPQVTLIPDLHFWVHRGYFEQRQQFRKLSVPWQDRLPKVFWRGSSTGALMLTTDSFRALARFRLCSLAASSPGLRALVDAKLTDIVQARNDHEGDKIHSMAQSLGILATRVPQTEFLKYRYQIDIDGNSNAWGFLLKLLMGSCVLKVMSDWRQWYYDGLRPWEHYVPVKNDLSDLEERISWCIDNDDTARQIAAGGTKYASAIVFGTEMPRAAARVLETSRSVIDDFFKPQPVPRD
jgi:hypothetical protein